MNNPANAPRDEWNPALAGDIDGLIADYGAANPSYDSANKPVAVFDFDNTTIFGDIGEQVFRRQVDKLIFRYTPDQFAAHMPDAPRGIEFFDHLYVDCPISRISADVSDNYEKLYAMYEGLRGDQPLHKVENTDEYHEFRAKICALYDGLNATMRIGRDFAYLWSVQMVAGLNPEQVRKLALDTWAYELRQPLGTETLRSPENLSSKSGALSVTMKTGIRPFAAMQRLFANLRGAGFDVFVVTATQDLVVEAIVVDPLSGYGVEPGRVVGVPLEIVDGLFTKNLDPRYRHGVTYGPGKVLAIKERIGRAPIFVGGDSDNDIEMLTNFPETRLRMVVDRGMDEIMKDIYGKCARGEDGFYLQKRDEKTGQFVAMKSNKIF